MFRKLLTISIFFSMCIFIFAQNHGEDKSAISFETIIDENKDFFEQNDSVEYLSSHKKVNGLQHYYIGSRRASDRLVASGGQNQSWPQPHNVQIVLNYPQQGAGATVTYVAIVVNQTTNLGQAYVVKGGIGSQQITVVVEGYNTLVFNIFAYIYGY